MPGPRDRSHPIEAFTQRTQSFRLPSQRTGVDLAGPHVELSYVDAVHERQRRPLLDCVTARFEDVVPVRPFRWSRGERHFAGWYWAATTGLAVVPVQPNGCEAIPATFGSKSMNRSRSRSSQDSKPTCCAADRLRPGGVGIRAGGDTGGGAAGECPVAVALPAPTMPAPPVRGPAAGGLRSTVRGGLTVASRDLVRFARRLRRSGPLALLMSRETSTRTAMKPRDLGGQHAPIRWTDDVDQEVPSHLRLRRT